ncbi:MAG: TolC family protein [candidate division FCPU426 bacterium]
MRKFLAGIGCLVIAVLCASPVLAAESTLTWEDCVHEAGTHNPDLAAKAERVRQAEANLQIALSPMLPQVSGGLSLSGSWAEDLSLSKNWNANLSVQQLLFDGMQSLHGYQGAAASLAAARFDYATTEAGVRLRLRQAYVELLLAQLMTGLTQDIEARRCKNLDLVKMRYEAGREHRGSLLLAQAQFAQAQANHAQAERDLLLAQYGLSQQLGREAFAPLQAAGTLDLPAVVPEPDFASLLEKHPGSLSLASQAESARLAAAEAAGDWYPTLSASGSIGRSGPDWWPDEPSLSAGLSLNWPLFTGFRRWSQVDKAQAAWRQAQAALVSGKNSLRYDLVSAWSNYGQALDNVAVQGQFLAAAEERARISQAEYTTGLIGFDNWTIIEDDLVSAKLAALNAHAKSQNAKAAWVQAQGGGLNVTEP